MCTSANVSPVPAPSRRQFIKFAGACAAAAAGMGLAGCSNGHGDSASQASSKAAPTVEDRTLTGDTDPTTVRVGLIMGPPSMGLSRFLIDAQSGDTYNSYEFEFCGVDYQAVAARLNQGDFDIVTLPSNLGAVLYNNEDIKTKVQAISVNNLGVLYGITTDPNVNELADLEGRTAYVYGEGGTPEYTIATVLEGHGLGDGKMNIVFKSTPFEVLNLLQDEENCIAILPQPFVALADTMVTGLRHPIDITAEWESMESANGSEAVTTHTVANREFLEEHELAVVEYLQRAGASVDWTLKNLDEASSCQVELGSFLNDDVARQAMPYISLVNLTGEVMYDALSGFLAAIHAQNPDSIGGDMPGSDFYYMPPAGALDADVRAMASAPDKTPAELVG